ncbi:MAG: LytTR family transcriptional regulator [Lachnospiraceae bacterium]|nr:LytTR family transcriptional regulator [Lachnospiraceae bacterium]
MSDLVDIKLIIDKDWPKLTVYIKGNERNEDVEGIIAAVQAYSEKKVPMIQAYFKGCLVMLPQRKIVRFYVDNRKVMAQTAERVYETKKALYEIEEILDKKKFVRISQSENINIKRVKNFDFSVTGTIGLELENGDITWVSRRRIKDVRALLAGGKAEVNTGGTSAGNAEENT